MNAVTVTEAKQHLEQLIDQVIADAEPTIVVTDAGQRVVVLSLDEFNSWRETLSQSEGQSLYGAAQGRSGHSPG